MTKICGYWCSIILFVIRIAKATVWTEKVLFKRCFCLCNLTVFLCQWLWKCLDILKHRSRTRLHFLLSQLWLLIYQSLIADTDSFVSLNNVAISSVYMMQTQAHSCICTDLFLGSCRQPVLSWHWAVPITLESRNLCLLVRGCPPLPRNSSWNWSRRERFFSCWSRTLWSCLQSARMYRSTIVEFFRKLNVDQLYALPFRLIPKPLKVFLTD